MNDQEQINQNVRTDIKQLYEHASIANQEMASIKTDMGIMKNDVTYLKEDTKELKTDVKEIKEKHLPEIRNTIAKWGGIAIGTGAIVNFIIRFI